MTFRNEVDNLLEHIKTGKILEAMDRFYADDLTMQENRQPPTKGKSANIEREKQFLAQVKEWKSTEILAVATEGSLDDGVSFVEYAFEFINTAGQPVRYEQASVQRWNRGRIVSERFYYDTGA
ncbi:MAG: nuclear transport factor 2 family protein [Phycisphaerales bacterium]|nr:nuclear transport factor 2 family protein [Phycisphaerales bacterium]